MTLHTYVAFFAVGSMLLVLGLVLLLAVPAPAVIVLLLGLVHVLVGLVLRRRTRGREVTQ